MALAGLAACGGGSRSSTELVREVRGYNNGLRWRDYASAALRMTPPERTAFLDRRDKLDDDLRIADWEMTRLEYDESRYRAVVQIEYTWMLDSRGIVHTTVARQFWARHGDRWLLDHEERLRGEPMPGVEEPKPKRAPRRQEPAERAPTSNAGTDPSAEAPVRR